MSNLSAINFKNLRKSAEYSCEDVAKALGISSNAYRDYESGKMEIPFDILEKASVLYGCDMIDLIDNNEIEKSISEPFFDLEGLTESDVKELMKFKDIVRSCLKMDEIAKHA